MLLHSQSNMDLKPWPDQAVIPTFSSEWYPQPYPGWGDEAWIPDVSCRNALI